MYVIMDMYYGSTTKKRKNYHYSPRDSREQHFVKACKQGDIDMVKYHIRFCTDPDAFVYGTTTLLAACIYNRWRVVKLLLKVAHPEVHGRDNLTPYMIACQRGHHKIIEILGNDSRVDPHRGRTFAKYPHVRPCIVKAKKFNPNRMYYGRSLLQQTCQHYYEDAKGVKLLLRVGADPNIADDQGVTPLMCAAKDGKATSLKLLLEGGADIHQVSHKGHTAFTTACYHHQYACAAILLHHGAYVWDRYDGKNMLELLEIKTRFYRKKEWIRERIRKEMRKVEKWHVAMLQLPSDVLRYISEFI